MRSACLPARGQSPARSGGIIPSAMTSLLLALTLAACNSSAPPPVAAVAAAPEPPAPGVVGVGVGRDLDEKDKAVAIAAQQAAVSSGSVKSWKGGHGAYGFITPGPENAGAGCRDYTHKVFINGRPQEAKGQACKSGDGWRVTS
jgi:surface antigen